MLKFPSLPRAPVCALTSVEATKMIPKWTEQDTVVDYCVRVRTAWEYCNGEDFDEGKFCKILKLNLPRKALQSRQLSEGDNGGSWPWKTTLFARTVYSKERNERNS